MLLFALAACGNRPQPLDLPTDPSKFGVPVGVRTVEYDGLKLEVWYPADDRASKDDPVFEGVDFGEFVSSDVTDMLGDLDLPLIETRAWRDVDIRPAALEDPWPVVIFSHGFGGTRTQSVDLTVHLASRGYIVVAPDHTGRTISELLPCLFLPPLDGCSTQALVPGGTDPALAHVDDVLDWIDEVGEQEIWHMDRGTIALIGHSAGGFTTTSHESDRFFARLPMAAGGVVESDVPVLHMVGSCDAIVPVTEAVAAHEASADSRIVNIEDAGHHAFDDICELDLVGIADELLAGRDDVNQTLLDGLKGLAADGCPDQEPTLEDCDAFLPLEISAPMVRHYATAFLDEQVGRGGPGITEAFPGVEVVK